VDLELGVYWRMELSDLRVVLACFPKLRIDLGCFSNCGLEESSGLLAVPDITSRASAPRKVVEQQ
jgi:hypothetical protein